MPTYCCGICKRQVAYGDALPDSYPFCSERCKMVDLGRWLREDYAIERDLRPEDAPRASPPPNRPANAQ